MKLLTTLKLHVLILSNAYLYSVALSRHWYAKRSLILTDKHYLECTHIFAEALKTFISADDTSTLIHTLHMLQAPQKIKHMFL